MKTNWFFKLEIIKVFDASADLSGISGDKGDLFINSITHKTFVEFFENDTEAAALTMDTEKSWNFFAINSRLIN